jgi:methylated-DNA-[protein]-cysteine S-methyltransferase
VNGYSAVIPFPVANFNLGLRIKNNDLIAIDFVPKSTLCSPTSNSTSNSKTDDFVRQLNAYLVSPSTPFDVPSTTQGTAFQQRVWQALKQIPAGESISYGALAKQLGTSARAVGNACRANPLPIVVPCHRVVSASGLGGFMGQTQGAELTVKQWLLKHEQRIKS